MPSANNKVSVIIPVYNRDVLIVETLHSVRSQSYINWECIIVDDGSTDDTVAVVKEFCNQDKRFFLYSRIENCKKGANTCRNIGVSKSSGDYLLFLDSDDILADECLANRVQTMESNSNLDFAVFDMGLLRNGEKEDYAYPDLSKKNKEELEKLFITGPLPWNMTRPFWKKNFFEQVGTFNENLRNFDDDEFNFRAIQQTIAFQFFRITDCYYRLYQENVEKYYHPEFVDKLLLSYDEFVTTIVHNYQGKTPVSKMIAYKTSAIIDAFLSTREYSHKFKKIVTLLKKNHRITHYQYFLLKVKILLHKMYKGKKGFSKMNGFLNNQLYFE